MLVEVCVFKFVKRVMCCKAACERAVRWSLCDRVLSKYESVVCACVRVWKLCTFKLVCERVVCEGVACKRLARTKFVFSRLFLKRCVFKVMCQRGVGERGLCGSLCVCVEWM